MNGIKEKEEESTHSIQWRDDKERNKKQKTKYVPFINLIWPYIRLPLHI